MPEHRVHESAPSSTAYVYTCTHTLHAGNGITDPAVQYGAYADFALQNNLVTQSQRDRIQAFYPHCKWAIDLCNTHHWPLACRGAVTFCENMIFEAIMAIAGNINVYDIRKPCIGPLCYDFSLMAEYLAQDDVRTRAPPPRCSMYRRSHTSPS